MDLLKWITRVLVVEDLELEDYNSILKQAKWDVGKVPLKGPTLEWLVRIFQAKRTKELNVNMSRWNELAELNRGPMGKDTTLIPFISQNSGDQAKGAAATGEGNGEGSDDDHDEGEFVQTSIDSHRMRLTQYSVDHFRLSGRLECQSQ